MAYVAMVCSSHHPLPRLRGADGRMGFWLIKVTMVNQEDQHITEVRNKEKADLPAMLELLHATLEEAKVDNPNALEWKVEVIFLRKN